MKKPYLFILLFLMISTSLSAQSVLTKENWDEIIKPLEAEQWQDAQTLTRQYLGKIDKDEDAAAILRYMNIYSTAGLLNDGKLTKKQALALIAPFKGQSIISSWFPIKNKYGLNTVQMVNDKPDTLMITATNRQGTNIFAFIYVKPETLYSLTEWTGFDGKNCRFGGTISFLDVEGEMLPRFRIRVDNAKLQIE
ncbi:MAG: hypothetical protein JKY70_13580 [Mucilaginibacter sp.]|nr:hypothetical protein [Mucilaginibacter sp.]